MSQDNMTSVRASTQHACSPRLHQPASYSIPSTILLHASSATIASTCRDPYRSRIENTRNSSNHTIIYPAITLTSTDCSIARLGQHRNGRTQHPQAGSRLASPPRTTTFTPTARAPQEEPQSRPAIDRAREQTHHRSHPIEQVTNASGNTGQPGCDPPEGAEPQTQA